MKSTAVLADWADKARGPLKGTTCDQIASGIEAWLRSAGFVIVPIEPTREMWAAGADATVGKALVHHDKLVGDVWPAMITASQRS